MAAHPGLSASKPPYRHTLPCAKQRCKKHERETDNAESEPAGTPATGALHGILSVNKIGDQRNGKNYCGSDGPSTLGAVNAHRSSAPSLVARRLADSIGKESFWIDAMSCVVRACVNTTGLGQIGAQVAGSGFLFYDCLGAAGTIGIFIQYLERMQIDIAVRAVARAQAAADAPILDDDFERIAAANGADRAAHPAEGVAALPTTGGNQILLEAQAIANETGNAIVSVRAGVNAGIAARAFLQIEDQQTLRFHQAL